MENEVKGPLTIGECRHLRQIFLTVSPDMNDDVQAAAAYVLSLFPPAPKGFTVEQIRAAAKKAHFTDEAEEIIAILYPPLKPKTPEDAVCELLRKWGNNNDIEMRMKSQEMVAFMHTLQKEDHSE